MKRLAFLFVGIVGMGAAVGCGSDDEPNPLATRAGFCTAWAERACNTEVVDSCAAASTSACRDAQENHCLSLVASDAYRQSRARACLDAVRTALERPRLNGEEAAVVLRGERECSFDCIEAEDGGCVEPTVAFGGDECSDPYTVCAEGTYCDGDNCLTRRGEGRECSAEIPCREELNCVSGVCEAKKANGEDCSDYSECASGVCAAGVNQCAPHIILAPSDEVCALFR